MKLTGTVKKWNDEKGYGFIRLDSGDEEYFFHINSFRHGNTRPSIGMVVNFELGADKEGRVQAKYVRVGEYKKSYPAIMAVTVSALFLGFVTAAVLSGRLPKVILLTYIATSIWVFILYQFDKSAAERGLRRTPEATLHNFSLMGGWPGALFAQQLFRHKSRKESFRNRFWATVFLNVSALVYLLTPYGTWLVNEIKRVLV